MNNYIFTTNSTYFNVLSFARGDVNGDGVSDNVYLTGTKQSNSPFMQNIMLVIQDGRTKIFTRIPLNQNVGYNPTVTLWDFTGDHIDDILIGIASGGSGAFMYYYIYSFVQNVPRLLFDFEQYNQQYQYEIKYKDNYKVNVFSKVNNETYIIDISYKGLDYLNEIYDANGKLKEPIEGFINSISGLYPIDFDSNGVYELLAFQKIAGRYNADSLGYIQNVLNWKDNKFVLDNQYVAIFGY